MKNRSVLLLALLLAAGLAFGDDAKPAAKKSENKAKPAAKSDKNVFQRAESSTGKFLHDNKIWTKSEPRGSLQNKPAKKSD
jgi:hypothetical protein